MATEVQKVEIVQISEGVFISEIQKVIKGEIDSLRQHYQPKEPAEYLSRLEVKDLLKIDLSTLHNWTKKGTLKAFGINGRVYYLRSDIDKAMVSLG